MTKIQNISSLINAKQQQTCRQNLAAFNRFSSGTLSHRHTPRAPANPHTGSGLGEADGLESHTHATPHTAAVSLATGRFGSKRVMRNVNYYQTWPSFFQLRAILSNPDSYRESIFENQVNIWYQTGRNECTQGGYRWASEKEIESSWNDREKWWTRRVVPVKTRQQWAQNSITSSSSTHFQIRTPHNRLSRRLCLLIRVFSTKQAPSIKF